MREPSLDWFPLCDAFEDGEPNLFSLLRWDYRFVGTLYGRDNDLRKILAWAESGSQTPSARLVTGEGGAGKTRLAATAAQMLRDKGWTAGFLPRTCNLVDLAVGEKGLFLIVDYPEEQPERTKALLSELAERKIAPYPLRLMFLSRQSFAEWERETSILQGRFGTHEIAAPAQLSINDGTGLIEEATRNFSTHTQLPTPDLREARRWLESSPLHQLPLYAMAAAIHAILSPKEAFGLAGAELLKQLARREICRVQSTSEALNLGREGLERLLALGVLADGLSENVISELAKAGVCENSNPDIVGALARSPWWKKGRLVRLEPDPIAAAFVDLTLFNPNFPKGRTALADWLFIALQENVATLGNRLGRVLYDLHTLQQSDEGTHPLEERLIEMVRDKPERALSFASIASVEQPIWAVNFAAHIALILAQKTIEPEVKAGYFNNAAGYLSYLGQHEEALAAAQEAVSFCRELARARPGAFTPNLAGSLNNLANTLSELGRHEEALAAAQEVAGLYRRLAQAHPEMFTPDLAGSLNNLANTLSELDRHEEALAAAQEVVGFYRGLAQARSETFTPSLAGSLNNLTNRLFELGKQESALAAAQEAVDIHRRLAQARPEMFTPNLAMSLNNLAIMLFELGKQEDALAAAQEAVDIHRGLARARPETFTPDLAGSLNNFALILSELGQHEEALKVTQELANLHMPSRIS
ncbi:tetratricopeptide repeat protein [Beijerinckia indica]|uniref:Tetratricopeptide TPR_2 repeat protein n=1 Tax=Beijerinckia indica subsp. indica (strain ATCC 9039 / DSM 1715 / NCIMB 8712) TaxID=395963 RepID=B2IJL8_BEII9|nr:tetratricopeptide repeat protein [Beijerinckia indica]ACB94890.1 Tetratricopeptide TPR_2 repeat protein [Beijerinckia indica subsp. indica ATCC 9039]